MNHHLPNAASARLNRLNRPHALTHMALAGLMLLTPTLQAAETDIANQPLASLPDAQAKPNLLFLLDNSGSMNWSYMPDNLGKSSSGTDEPYTDWFGYWSPQCNGVAFDPSADYPPPLKADKTSYPAASFTAARSDGYDTNSSTTDLSNRYYYTYSGSQKQMGWVYNDDGTVDNNTFYQECRASIAYDGSSVFTKVLVSSQSPAIQQKYANWYAYYRKRYLLMRTAMGRALNNLDNSYRIGFSSIYETKAKEGLANGKNPASPPDGESAASVRSQGLFLDVRDFDVTQKGTFYTNLYQTKPYSGTPLRAALSTAGRYFAKNISGQTGDPVQYACQRNYALLSTDGYWNGDAGKKLATTAGSTPGNVGQQDGAENRPMRDDTTPKTKEVVTYTGTSTRNDKGALDVRYRDWTKTTVVSSTKGTGIFFGNGCSSSTYKVGIRTQTASQYNYYGYVTPQSATATYTETTEYANGVKTSGPIATTPVYGTWKNSGSAQPVNTDGPLPTAANYDSGYVSYSCKSSAGTIGATTGPTAGGWSGGDDYSPRYEDVVDGAFTPGAPVVTDISTSGVGDTLADVAQYFYATDLRTPELGNCTATSGKNVCGNIVKGTTDDPAKYQHLNTYTIGLGVSGTLPYDKDYLTQTSGTYVDLSNPNGILNWPTPSLLRNPSVKENATHIDDLWHAAVNGRGRYYSALNAGLLSEAIDGVVSSIQAATGSAAAAATSSLELVSGNNNQVYRASYTTEHWYGDLESFSLDGTSLAISATPTWSAKAKLEGVAPDDRKIFFNGTSGVTDFQYSNLTDTQKAYFDNLCAAPAKLTQCAGLASNAAALALANSGSNVVGFLRGVRTYESQTKTSGGATLPQIYRNRQYVLGDVINGAPVHVAKPPFSYGDTGYADFAADNASRAPVVYVGANDGMLHAFSGAKTDGGGELWAFVPSAVMRNMHKLADTSYNNNHQYFVDGAPVMGDIKVGSTWKTILVGGLNKGGKAYYALDITNPTSPKVLWEISNETTGFEDLGLSYGNPIITKRADGTWVVIFASGYNNQSGDGEGHLYVVNANTGARLLTIDTDQGDKTTPSGLAKINAWVETVSDNTTKRVYGGDMLGNVWRFDIDSLVEPKLDALRLAQLQIDSNTPQPITTRPITVEVKGKPVVIVATGRYLGESDIDDETSPVQQAIYAIKDPLTDDGWGDVRSDTTHFVRQTFTLNNSNPAEATSASISENEVDWTSKAGWWVDLPQARERVVNNMAMQLNTLVVASAIPSGDACASGGASWRYYLNVADGSKVSTNPVGTRWSESSMIVGINWVKNADGKVRVIFQNGDGSIQSEKPPESSGGSSGEPHRTSWRELAN